MTPTATVTERGESRHGDATSRGKRILYGRSGPDTLAEASDPLRLDQRERLDTLRTADGRCMPPHLKARILREVEHIEFLLRQLVEVCVQDLPHCRLPLCTTLGVVFHLGTCRFD
jgi:hypothetical protein